jgi:hypothetical protein
MPAWVDLLSGAGAPCNGVVLFQAEKSGLIDNETASQRLSSLADI